MRKSKLQEEIQQTRPFRSRRQEAVVGLFRTADLLRRTFSRLVEGAGITLQQYNVLRILRGAGDKALPTLTIAERMIERTPGITRLLDRLERKGWVSRQRASADRRQVLCRITPEGLALLASLDGPMNDADDNCLTELSETELAVLVDLLDRVRDGLRDADCA